MKKNAIMLTWSGFQDHEVVYPYYRLLGDEFKVSIVADKRDSQNRVYGILGLSMPCHYTINEFYKNIEDFSTNFDLMILPGGVKSLEKLRQEEKVINFINKWNNEGKIISSTCHGAQLLISSKVVRGRNIAGYYSLKDDITNAGAIYSREPFIVDKNIISSPHYDHMGIWMEETIKEYNKKYN
jgi:protease I